MLAKLVKPNWTWHDYRARRFNGVRLTSMQADLLCLLVLRGGWERDALVEALHVDDPGGGPEYGRDCLGHLYRKLNRRIAPWEIVSERNGDVTLRCAPAVKPDGFEPLPDKPLFCYTSPSCEGVM